MLGTHTVSLMSFDAMADGASDSAVVEQLRLVNQSRQLALLRAVLDRAREYATSLTPLPSLDEAWTLLANVEVLDKAAADQVIAYPRTSLWAARSLRLLNKESGAGSDPPLWFELGYLHLLAAAAAIRAKCAFRLRVPVWRGTVMLPTLGLADVRSRREWDFAQVQGENDSVLIRGTAGSAQVPDDPAADGDGWMALRTLRADGCELWFDDIDPYREFDGPIPPHRLSKHEVDQWANEFRATWRLLTTHHPSIAAELSAGLTSLVPHAMTDRLEPFSGSHHEVFGSVMLSKPPDPTTFAATLVHELQHGKFGVLLTLIDLLDPVADNDIAQLYAPWRDDPRPPTAVLHGVFSFLGVTAFYRQHHTVMTGSLARTAQFEFAYSREQTLQATETLLAEAALSALGRRFLTRARDQLSSWATDPLPEDVRAAAHRANLDHRLTWRLRHLQPSGETVEQLVTAWLRHRPKPCATPPEPLLKPSTGTPVHARLALVRTWLTKPELYDDYRAEPDLAMTEIRGTTEADLALVDGQAAEAAELYRLQILGAPDSPTSWAGLALSSENDLLLSRPELALAVHREIRSRTGAVTNPVRLAEWLG
jgi:HEXXH motif-containing protein